MLITLVLVQLVILLALVQDRVIVRLVHAILVRIIHHLVHVPNPVRDQEIEINKLLPQNSFIIEIEFILKQDMYDQNEYLFSRKFIYEHSYHNI